MIWRIESEQTMTRRVSLPMLASKPCEDRVTATAGCVGVDSPGICASAEEAAMRKNERQMRASRSRGVLVVMWPFREPSWMVGECQLRHPDYIIPVCFGDRKGFLNGNGEGPWE